MQLNLLDNSASKDTLNDSLNTNSNDISYSLDDHKNTAYHNFDILFTDSKESSTALPLPVSIADSDTSSLTIEACNGISLQEDINNTFKNVNCHGMQAI